MNVFSLQPRTLAKVCPSRTPAAARERNQPTAPNRAVLPRWLAHREAQWRDARRRERPAYLRLHTSRGIGPAESCRGGGLRVTRAPAERALSLLDSTKPRQSSGAGSARPAR